MRHIVISRQDLQLTAGQQGLQVLAHGHRADGVGIAPYQQTRRGQGAQVRGQVGHRRGDSHRQIWVGGLVCRAPVLRPKGRHINPCGCHSQHQMRHLVRARQSHAHRHDAAHRLAKQHHGVRGRQGIQLLHRPSHQPIQMGEACNVVLFAKTRPGQAVAAPTFRLQAARHGLPECARTPRTGQKQRVRTGGFQRASRSSAATRSRITSMVCAALGMASPTCMPTRENRPRRKGLVMAPADSMREK